ncbi:acetate--CoA ligase family protein [Alicyclobacillus cycloheptanicus]|uniref:Acyl-CoA synthetase (NDP forming) n=1 Tax=Alicyclobacillus cycloheptanicus TaxID=1457 RepID=A0ABT9XIE1_9BACL|nr:acetate--CoA ligase family protein [Alicyclobacillus cycloheptanicus]MDQ0189481.1 acyl-CoA synthetase (NDP forming) [Alicyclobacillus cycloheptanicus]WDM01548.1 acetate--CoA ligase family protein [Alicyclobacillus cycloheptanicus]
MTSLVTPERLCGFFRPRRIALVGATDKSRWSVFTYTNLKTFGGDSGVVVDCVHPLHKTVHGQRTVPSLCDIDGQVDLAYVMVPTTQVLPVLEDAHKAKIRNLVILTAGFREIGGEGAELEREVLAYARTHDQVLLGPNGNGFIHASEQLAPYGLLITPPLLAGPVGIVLQSGALASSVLTLAQARNIGISLLVSMGNEAMISATDVMEYLIEDERTKVIAVFLETIRQPHEFARVAKKAMAHGKPIVALKIGRSERSAQSAMAHTGAIVGDDAVNDAVLRQLGVIRVHALEDLITTAGVLGYVPPLSGRRMGVVTPSGGACDILSDRAADEGLELPDFTPETANRLKDIVPAFSTVHNPLDVTGFVVVDSTLLRRALAATVDDPNVDFLVCLTDPPRVEPPDATPLLEQWRHLREIVDTSNKPIVIVSNTSVDITAFGRSVLQGVGLHVVGGMEHGMTAIAHAVWWHEQRRRCAQRGPSWCPAGLAEAAVEDEAAAEGQTPVASGARALRAESEAQKLPAGSWSEWSARRFLTASGIPFVPGILAQSAAEAVDAAAQVGYPVALKVQSPDILHKSDVGGVALGLATAAEVRNAYRAICHAALLRVPNCRLDGVLVTPMRSKGVEVLVGVVRDPLWGPVLAVGLGGIWVEALQDTRLRVLPVDAGDIREMLHELRGYPLLRGGRGRAGVDEERLAAVIGQIAAVAVGLGERLEALEVNPLWAQGSQVEALDALISLGPEVPRGV